MHARGALKLKRISLTHTYRIRRLKGRNGGVGIVVFMGKKTIPEFSV